MLLDTLDGVAAPGIRRVIAVDPPSASNEIRAFAPPDVEVMPQISGSLGQRMRALMADLFERGARGVAVVGSDLPDIAPRMITAAFATLVGDPDGLVLGPAADGGYYLIAATRPPEVFDGIEWGSQYVLGQTQAVALRAGLRVSLLETMSDVDSADDLRRVMARRTSAWFRSHRGSG